MHSLILLYINHHRQFEVSSFINCKDIIGQKLKQEVQPSPRDPLDTLYQLKYTL